jgi:cardiolipin synthase (CMP-forming)
VPTPGPEGRRERMRVFDIGQKDGPQEVSSRILTVPNLLSFARLAVLPIVYLDLVEGRLLRAFVLLVVFASTDWLDGYIARRFDQLSELGRILDPISDRILFVVVGIGFIVSGLLPLWAVLLILLRDLFVGGAGVVMLARGVEVPAVTRLGKAATFGLMFALPTFLLAAIVGDGVEDPNALLWWIGWATYASNIVLYWLSAFGYLRTVRARARGAEAAATTAGPDEAGSGELG